MTNPPCQRCGCTTGQVRHYLDTDATVSHATQEECIIALRQELAGARNEFKNRVGTEEQFRNLYTVLTEFAQPLGTGGSLHTLGMLALSRHAAAVEAAFREGDGPGDEDWMRAQDAAWLASKARKELL